jgi:hypothetical protein
MSVSNCNDHFVTGTPAEGRQLLVGRLPPHPPATFRRNKRGRSPLSRPVLYCAALSALITGCQVPWRVPTLYNIRDVEDSATQNELKQALSEYGYTRVNAPSFSFVLTDLQTVEDVKTVQMIIQDISKRNKVPVQFNGATMDFYSVSGTGKADINLEGTSTPGAEVYLDTGDPETIVAEVKPDGSWTAGVKRTTKLRDRGGWIYGVFVKQGLKQYVKINVLDTSSAKKIRENELPSDSVLRK